MGKCLGLDTGMAMMGIDPGNVDKIPALPILADIIRRDEDLRHAGQVPEPIKERLRQPGAEFTLIGDHYIPIDFTGWGYFELIEPEGEIPWLEAGSSEVRFECGGSAGVGPRANVTVISFGDPLK